MRPSRRAGARSTPTAPRTDATDPVTNPPQRYRHYKGGIYELVCEATLESDLTPMIVYKSSNGSAWIRPKDVFFESVEVDGQKVQRFAPIA